MGRTLRAEEIECQQAINQNFIKVSLTEQGQTKDKLSLTKTAIHFQPSSVSGWIELVVFLSIYLTKKESLLVEDITQSLYNSVIHNDQYVMKNY